MRFGLKTIFVGTSLFAVFFVICLKAGTLVAIGMALAIATFLWSLRSKKRGYFYIPRIAVALVSLVAVWFLAVDWSWHRRGCVICWSDLDVCEYRVLGFTISSEFDSGKSIVTRVLEDLGHPCDHHRIDGYHKHRWWGLVVCACPCWNGIDGLSSGDEIYTDEIAVRVREIGQINPELGSEVYRRIDEQQDYRYFWNVIMTDLFVEQAIADSQAFEAIKWLGEGRKNETRLIGHKQNSEESLRAIQEMYDAGASEVLATEIETTRLVKINATETMNLTNDLETRLKEIALANPKRQFDHINQLRANSLFLKLSSRPEDRNRLVKWVNTKMKWTGRWQLIDEGQQYIRDVSID